MPTLSEIRQNYPQYNDLSDEAFADAFHKKFYSDMSREEFASKLEPSWGQVFLKAKENMPSPMEYVKSQFTNPIEDVKNMGKLVLGGAENALGFEPGQQISNEQDVANRFGEHYGNYLSEEGWKKNISEDPTGTLADVLTFGRAPVRAATGVGRRIVTPNPARPGFGDAANILREEGVPQTAGQATGRRSLKYAESELGGGATQNLLDQQLEGYTRAGSRRIGEDTPHLTPDVLNRARGRIGNEFEQVGLRNNIPPDPQLNIDLTNAVHTYVASVPQPAPGIAGMAQAIQARAANGIGGRQYNQFRSRLSRLQRNTRDPELITAYGDIREALDNAMERSLQARGNTADLQTWTTARQQYRNLMVLQNAMATGGEDISRGLLTPGKLEHAAAAGPNRSWYARGLSDFSDLGKAGQVGMSKMPESGTAVRGAIRGATALAGGLLAGGGAIGPEAAAGAAAGIAAPPLMGRALMSRPVQAYLGNQLLPQRPPAAPGSRTIPPAIVAGSRETNLSHAESVLSPEVLSQVKSFAPKELNAWLTTRSPETTMALAQIIAQKANRPDLIERIAAELGAQ